MLRSVVVDGGDILVSAKKASQISLARLEAREAAVKEKTKREEERVRELKKVRGEKWLPSVARQMKVSFDFNIDCNSLSFILTCTINHCCIASICCDWCAH